MTKISTEKLWESVRKLKLQSSFDKECDEDCILFSGTEKESQVGALENILETESSDDRLQNMTYESLKTAGEIFIYLNIHPGETLKPWFDFFKDLFQTQSPDKIVLTLNRIMKGPQNKYGYGSGDNEAIQIITKMLFMRITDFFSLMYKELQTLLPGKERNIKKIFQEDHTRRANDLSLEGI